MLYYQYYQLFSGLKNKKCFMNFDKTANPYRTEIEYKNITLKNWSLEAQINNVCGQWSMTKHGSVFVSLF